jgi:hypothetical protein
VRAGGPADAAHPPAYDGRHARTGVADVFQPARVAAYPPAYDGRHARTGVADVFQPARVAAYPPAYDGPHARTGVTDVFQPARVADAAGTVLFSGGGIPSSQPSFVSYVSVL